VYTTKLDAKPYRQSRQFFSSVDCESMTVENFNQATNDGVVRLVEAAMKTS
jgi:hypothetical protein